MENGLKKNERNGFLEVLCMLPAFMFLLSILLVRLHMFSMPMTDIYWSEATDTSTLSDLFCYWKSIIIIGSACLAIIVAIVGYLKDFIHIKKSFLYIPGLVYAAFTLLSLIFSEYKYFALHGMSEHFEGTIVLLAYIIMLFYLVNVIENGRRLKHLVYCALGAAFLLCILGVTQATGHDFLSTATGQKIITPNFTLGTGLKSWDMIDSLSAAGQRFYNFSFTKGEVYQTVYNINYVPFYLVLLIPISALMFISCQLGDNKIKKTGAFVFLIVYGSLLYNLFSANSASGYFGLAIIFAAFLIIFHKRVKKWTKQIVCLAVVLGLVMGITVDRWLPDVKKYVGLLRYHAIESVYANNEHELPYDYGRAPMTYQTYFDYVETIDNSIALSMRGNRLVINKNSDGSFVFGDDEGNQLLLKPIDADNTQFAILDDRFYDFVTVSLGRVEDEKYLVIHLIDCIWRFHYDDSGFRYRNAVGKDVLLSKVPHAGIIKNYKMASIRGRIWDTTISMLPKFLIYGAGADGFVFVFPQNDYATLVAAYGPNAFNIVTDKAHNLYMQYWVNTGLISLLAWLTLVGYYLIGAVKSFKKRGFEDFSDFVNGGIFCGILGFLAIAVFNDGSVNTMPMFYTMLGTGLAINMRDKWPGGDTDGKAVKQKGAAMPEV